METKLQDSHQEMTTQIYDINAQKYKSWTQDFVFPGNMFEYFVWQLWKNSKILDVWCAYGRDIIRLKNLWYKVSWLEISPKLIAQAEEEIRENIIKWDMTRLEEIFKGENFDGIISSASIVHMDHEIGISVMKQIYSLLSDRWYFYLSLKVDTAAKTEYKESISTPWCMKKYVYYGEAEIEEILKNIWFQIKKTHIWKPQSDSWKILILQK